MAEDNILEVSSNITQYSINFVITDNTDSCILTIPKPFLRKGIYVLKSNSVERPLNTYYLKEEDKLFDYMDLTSNILLEDITPYLTYKTYRGVINSIKHLKFTHASGNFLRGVYNIQKIIKCIERYNSRKWESRR